MDKSDKQLIADYLAGDEKSLEILFGWHFKPPKKNWKLLNLAVKPLRIRGGFLAACGGEMRSD